MGQIISWLSGAGSQANQVGSYYNDALQQILGSVQGPVGQSFVADQNAALQPQFQTQDKQLAAQEAAMGITNSGAAKNDFSQLTNNQSATLAGADAPLYTEALGAYGSTAGAGAGAQANAYTGAINTFYNTLAGVGEAAAGAPPTSQTTPESPAAPNYNPYGSSEESYNYDPANYENATGG